MLSPSSFPQTSEMMSEGKKGDKERKPRTFEYNGILRNPDVPKSPSLLGDIEKYPARLAQVIRENADPLMQVSHDRLSSESIPIVLW